MFEQIRKISAGLQKSKRRAKARKAQNALEASGPTPRILFLHVPKCGGTSIRRFLDDRFDAVRLELQSDRDDWHGSLQAAKTAPLVYGHFSADQLEQIRGDAFVFSFLRDPLDRLVSHFRYHCSIGWAGSPDARYGETLTDFVTFPVHRNVMTSHFGGSMDPGHGQSISDEKQLARAIATAESLDAIGYTETLAQSFPVICQRGRIAYGDGPQIENVTPRVSAPVEITEAVHESLELDRIFHARVRKLPNALHVSGGNN